MRGGLSTIELANRSRIGGTSGFAPLHQAAWHGADVAVVDRLVRPRAWRTLSTTADETPADIARRRGHIHLDDVLRPRIRTPLLVGDMARVEGHFHALVVRRAGSAARHPYDFRRSPRSPSCRRGPNAGPPSPACTAASPISSTGRLSWSAVGAGCGTTGAASTASRPQEWKSCRRASEETPGRRTFLRPWPAGAQVSYVHPERLCGDMPGKPRPVRVGPLLSPWRRIS